MALITEEEADRLGEAEILELIFKPGLQYRRTYHRGFRARRGHGRGAERFASPEGLGRHRDPPGQGTTFRLKLPLTLAIIQGLVVLVEQRLYAIPLNAVAEIARARESDVHQVDNYEVLQLRNRFFPWCDWDVAPARNRKRAPTKFLCWSFPLANASWA